MHHIYHTPSFILSGSDIGEANRTFAVFTRELGLIRASAQGVRFQKSKLRYSLHELSFSDISLVRGKEFWRVTGAVQRDCLYESLRGNPHLLAVFGRVFALLLRLLSGEEKNSLLWSYLEEAFRFAATAKLAETAPVRNFECIFVLRILSSLGYLGASPETAAFVETPFWSEEILGKMNLFLPRALTQINRSLKESQL